MSKGGAHKQHQKNDFLHRLMFAPKFTFTEYVLFIFVELLFARGIKSHRSDN